MGIHMRGRSSIGTKCIKHLNITTEIMGLCMLKYKGRKDMRLFIKTSRYFFQIVNKILEVAASLFPTS